MRTIFTIIILAGVTWFAIGNAEAVTLKLFLWEYSVSLALIVVISFILGFILGLLRLAPGLLSKKSQTKQAQEQLTQVTKERDELQTKLQKLETAIQNTKAPEITSNTPQTNQQI
jgi:uncharacterized integral membrane protein